MANIILPQVNILNEINDSATMLVEQNGEINRFSIADLDIGGGDVTIDLEDSNISKPNPVNADTLGGRSPEEYIALANDYTNQQVKKAAPRNLLDNSDFTNPVNQRGQTSYTASGYTIDRWRTWEDTASVILNNGYLTHKEALYQYIPGLDKDKIYTLAFQNANGEIHVMSGKPSDNLYVFPGMNISYDANIGVFVRFWDAEGYNNKVWAALYEGEYTIETLPEYQPKGYGAELAECQRYYQTHLIISDKSGWGYTNRVIPVPCGMRIIPTITHTVLQGTGTVVDASAINNKMIYLTCSDIENYMVIHVQLFADL